MSALSQASYFFEPLWVFGPSIEGEVKKNKSLVPEIRDTINGIFNCDDGIIRKMNTRGKTHIIVRKNGNVCKATNPKVIKTIRLHKPGLEPWIYKSGIKVVHLVRDPRGIIASRAKAWNYDAPGEATATCSRVRDDLSLEAGLGNHYVRVRYEDLVDNPEAELQRVYHSLQMPFTEDVKRFIFEHTHETNDAESASTFGTHREVSFRHDSWKTKILGEKIALIEEDCKDIMDILDYRPYRNGTL